jgi:hypothetical protein
MPATRLLIQSVYDRSMYLMFPVNEYDSWAPKCPLHFSMVLKAGQIQYGLKGCEGCFCNNATWRAEGDHDMDFDIEKGVAEPKTQPRARSSAQGLVGHFSRMFKS